MSEPQIRDRGRDRDRDRGRGRTDATRGPRRALATAVVVMGVVGAVASASLTHADEGRLGRFELQVDGVGATRAIAFAGDGVVLLDEAGGLVGAGDGPVPAGGRDLAVADGRVALAGRTGIHVRPLPGGDWRLVEPAAASAVDLHGDRLTAILDDGSVVAWDLDPGDDSIAPAEAWRRPEAHRGARGVVGLPDGGAWVADTDRHRLVRLGPDGDETVSTGARGAFPGLFNTPVDLAISGGRLLVADRLNHRISVHRLDDGAFLHQWGMHAVVPRQGEGAVHYPEGVAVADDGDRVVVMEPFERRYQVFGVLPEGEEPSGSSLPGKRGVESHFGPDVAAAGGRLALWEPESGAAMAFDLGYGIPVHVTTFGEGAAPPIGFGRLVAVGVDGSRHDLWFVDAGHRRIHRWTLRPDRPEELIFDPFMGRFARGWSFDRIHDALPDSEAFEPVDLVVDDGRLHFLDAAGPSVVVTDRTLAVDRVIALPSGTVPTQLALRVDGGWLVVDAEARRLLGLDAAGAVDRDVDLGGLGLVTPHGVAEAGDLVVISDRGTDRLHSIDADGRIAVTAGETGAWDGALWRPAGLVTIPWKDEGSVVVVVDQGNHRAQGFDPTTGEWRVSFSLGQGHDRPMLLKEDSEPPAGPVAPDRGTGNR